MQKVKVILPKTAKMPQTCVFLRISAYILINSRKKIKKSKKLSKTS